MYISILIRQRMGVFSTSQYASATSAKRMSPNGKINIVKCNVLKSK